MKATRPLAGALLGMLLLLPACRRDREPNKLIDGAVIDVTQVIMPARICQQLLLLERDVMNILIPVMNKLEFTSSTYPELSGPTGVADYTFINNSSRYGTATTVIKFFNASGTQIDPIATPAQGLNVARVDMSMTGQSTYFTHNASGTVSILTVGIPTSDKFFTGSWGFSGSGETLTFTFTSPGSKASFQGFVNGTTLGTGTGPNSTTTSARLAFASSLDLDGSLTWANKSGVIHISDDGDGYIVVDDKVIPIN